MYKNKKISLVIPAFNEVTQIAKVIMTIPDFVDVIIVVDDASEDRTSNVVKKLSLYKSKKVILINHLVNEGVGGAIASGYKWALKNNFDIAVVMAGDGQMNPADLKTILDPLVRDQADYVKGNRLIAADASKKIPMIRLIGNIILSFFTKIASGYWAISDSQTGYAGINKKALRAINWDKMYKRYGQPNDILVRLNVAEMRVGDVIVEPVYNVGEKSGIKIHKVIFTISILMLRLFAWRMKEKYILRNFHPLVFFYFFGAICLVISLIFFVRFVLLWVNNGSVPELSFLIWLFTFSIAFNSFSFAMWFDYQENKHLNMHLIH
jgi:glycosyltransferase involved in cell wall biosynthesis